MQTQTGNSWKTMLRSEGFCWACSWFLFNCRGANPPSCDSGTGQNSRWRLRYDVYQYFLPENELSEMVLMNHIRKMSEVESIKANGIKVSLKHWCTGHVTGHYLESFSALCLSSLNGDISNLLMLQASCLCLGFLTRKYMVSDECKMAINLLGQRWLVSRAKNVAELAMDYDIS